MGIVLRPYQDKAIKQLGSLGTQVLSICPGGGKTITAIEYAKANNFNKVLVLAHGTTVLRTQWIQAFQNDYKDLSFSDKVEDNAQFTIQLPQSLKSKKTLPNYDLVIIDEAHEFYYADMVQKILKKVNPKATLCLTGTPSKFIRKGLKPVIISGVEVFQAGVLADAYIGLVKSDYSVSMSEFNLHKDVKEGVKFLKKETKSALNGLVKEMINRLKLNNGIKDSINLLNTGRVLSLNKLYEAAFTSLDKTMIACKDIAQAQDVYSLLTENGVKSVISTSDDDFSTGQNKEIEDFQKDPSIKVLVVVRRGILGFNFTELVNVVDFTLSRNIDRIYQLYARVIRKSETDKKKYFFRMCSALNSEIDAYTVQASLCLNNEEFISKYNGRNLNGLEVIVPKRDKKRAGGSSASGSVKSNKKSYAVDAIMAHEILSLGLLTELTVNGHSKYWNEFKYAKYGSVIEKLTGKKFERKIVNITEENLLYMIKTGKIDERIYEEDYDKE